MIPRIPSPKIRQYNLLLGEFYAPVAPQVAAPSVQALQQRAAQQRAAFLHRSRVTQVMDVGANPLVQRRIAEEYGIDDSAWRSATQTVGGVTGALAGIYTGARTGFMLTGWSANPISVIGGTVLGAVIGGITGAQLGRAAGGAVSFTGMAATGELIRNHIMDIVRDPISGFVAAGGQVLGSYLTAKLPVVNRLGSLRRLAVGMGGALGMQGTTLLSDLIMDREERERYSQLNLIGTMGNFLDNISGATTVKSAIYGATSGENFFDTLNKAYGFHEEGFTQIDFSDIRKSLGLDFTPIGNTIIDFAGEMLVDPSNYVTSTRQNIVNESREVTVNRMRLEQAALRTEVQKGNRLIESLTPDELILYHMDDKDFLKMNDYFLESVYEADRNSRRVRGKNTAYDKWKADLLNRGKRNNNFSNKWIGVSEHFGDQFDNNMRGFFERQQNIWLNGVSDEVLSQYINILKKTDSIEEIRNQIARNSTFGEAQAQINKALAADFEKMRASGKLGDGFAKQKSRFIFIKRWDDLDDSINKVTTAILNPQLAIMRNLDTMGGFIKERFSVEKNNEYVEIKDVNGITTFKRKGTAKGVMTPEVEARMKELFSEIDNIYEVDAENITLMRDKILSDSEKELARINEMDDSTDIGFQLKEQALKTYEENLLARKKELDKARATVAAKQAALEAKLEELHLAVLDESGKYLHITKEHVDLFKERLKELKANKMEQQYEFSQLTKYINQYNVLEALKEQAVELGKFNSSMRNVVFMANAGVRQIASRIRVNEVLQGSGEHSRLVFEHSESQKISNNLVGMTNLSVETIRNIIDKVDRAELMKEEISEFNYDDFLTDEDLEKIETDEQREKLYKEITSLLRSAIKEGKTTQVINYNEFISDNLAREAILQAVDKDPAFIKLKAQALARMNEGIEAIDHRLSEESTLTEAQRSALINLKEEIINSYAYTIFTRNDYYINERLRDHVSLEIPISKLHEVRDTIHDHMEEPLDASAGVEDIETQIATVVSKLEESKQYFAELEELENRKLEDSANEKVYEIEDIEQEILDYSAALVLLSVHKVSSDGGELPGETTTDVLKYLADNREWLLEAGDENTESIIREHSALVRELKKKVNDIRPGLENRRDILLRRLDELQDIQQRLKGKNAELIRNIKLEESRVSEELNIIEDDLTRLRKAVLTADFIQNIKNKRKLEEQSFILSKALELGKKEQQKETSALGKKADIKKALVEQRKELIDKAYFSDSDQDILKSLTNKSTEEITTMLENTTLGGVDYIRFSSNDSLENIFTHLGEHESGEYDPNDFHLASFEKALESLTLEDPELAYEIKQAYRKHGKNITTDIVEEIITNYAVEELFNEFVGRIDKDSELSLFDNVTIFDNKENSELFNKIVRRFGTSTVERTIKNLREVVMEYAKEEAARGFRNYISEGVSKFNRTFKKGEVIRNQIGEVRTTMSKLPPVLRASVEALFDSAIPENLVGSELMRGPNTTAIINLFSEFYGISVEEVKNNAQFKKLSKEIATVFRSINEIVRVVDSVNSRISEIPREHREFFMKMFDDLANNAISMTAFTKQINIYFDNNGLTEEFISSFSGSSQVNEIYKNKMQIFYNQVLKEEGLQSEVEKRIGTNNYITSKDRFLNEEGFYINNKFVTYRNFVESARAVSDIMSGDFKQGDVPLNVSEDSPLKAYESFLRDVDIVRYNTLKDRVNNSVGAFKDDAEKELAALEADLIAQVDARQFGQYMTQKQIRLFQALEDTYEATGNPRHFVRGAKRLFRSVKQNFGGNIQVSQNILPVMEALDPEVMKVLDMLDNIFNGSVGYFDEETQSYKYDPNITQSALPTSMVSLNHFKNTNPDFIASADGSFNKIGTFIRHTIIKQQLIREFSEMFELTKGMQETEDTAVRTKLFDILIQLDKLNLFNVDGDTDYAYNSHEALLAEINKLHNNKYLDKGMLEVVIEKILPYIEDIRTNGTKSQYANLTGIGSGMSTQDIKMLGEYLNQYYDKYFEGDDTAFTLHDKYPSYEFRRNSLNTLYKSRGQIKNLNDALGQYVFTADHLNTVSSQFGRRLSMDAFYTIRRNRTLREQAAAKSKFNELVYGDDNKQFMSIEEHKKYQEDYDAASPEEKMNMTPPDKIIRYDAGKVTGFSPAASQSLVINRITKALSPAVYKAVQLKVKELGTRYSKAIILDLETSGLDATKGEIIEIGAKVYDVDDKGTMTETAHALSSFINILSPSGLSANIEELTNISLKDLTGEQAKSLRNALLELAEVITEDTIIMGYNVGFDLNFLMRNMKKLFPDLPDSLTSIEFIDILDLYRDYQRAQGIEEGATLTDAMSRLRPDVDTDTAHRAVEDVGFTKMVLDSLIEADEDLTYSIEIYDPVHINTYQFLDTFNYIYNKGSVNARERALGLYYYDRINNLYKKNNPDSPMEYVEAFKEAGRINPDYDHVFEGIINKLTNPEDLEVVLGLYFMSKESEGIFEDTEGDLKSVLDMDLMEDLPSSYYDRGRSRIPSELKQARSDELSSKFVTDIYDLKRFYTREDGTTDTAAMFRHIKSDPNVRMVAIMKSSTARTRPIYNLDEPLENPYDPVTQRRQHARFESELEMIQKNREEFMKENPQAREVVIDSEAELQQFLAESEANGELAVGLMSIDNLKTVKSITTERYKLPPGLDYFYRNIMKVMKSEALVSMQFHWRNMWEIIQKNLHTGRGIRDIRMFFEKGRKSLELDSLWNKYDQEMYRYKMGIISDIENKNYDNIDGYMDTLMIQKDYLLGLVKDPSTNNYTRYRSEATLELIDLAIAAEGGDSKLHLINQIFSTMGFDTFVRQIHLKNFSLETVKKFAKEPEFSNSVDVYVYNKLQKRYGDNITEEMYKEAINEHLKQLKLVNDFHTSNANNFMSKMEIERMREISNSRGYRVDDQMFNYLAFNNPLSRAYMGVGERLERIGRLQNYLMEVENGASVDQAVSQVVKNHFDYSDRSPLETWATLIFPFISYPSRNLSLWVDMFQDAGTVRALHGIMMAMWGNYDEEDDDSEYIQHAKSQGWVPMPLGGGKYTLLKLGSPGLDAIKLLEDPLGEMYNRLNPMIRTITEAFSKKTPYIEGLYRSLPYARRIPIIQDSIERYQAGTHNWMEAFMPGIAAPIYTNRGNNKAGNQYRNIYKNLYNSRGLARPAVYSNPYQRVKSIQYRIASRRYSK